MITVQPVYALTHPVAVCSISCQTSQCGVPDADGKAHLYQMPDAFRKAALLPEGLAQQVIALQRQRPPLLSRLCKL